MLAPAALLTAARAVRQKVSAAIAPNSGAAEAHFKTVRRLNEVITNRFLTPFYHSMRPTSVWKRRLPTSLKLPRVLVKRPKVLRFAALYTRIGSEKLMCLYGLLTSQRNWKRIRSFRVQVFESDVCAQIMPGEVSVLRPSVPTVNGAG